MNRSGLFLLISAGLFGVSAVLSAAASHEWMIATKIFVCMLIGTVGVLVGVRRD